MARAAGCRRGDGAARCRPCPVTSRSAFSLAIAVAVCSVGVGAAAVSGRDGSSAATKIIFSSLAGQAFAPEDVVTVKYTSPLAWPVLTTWCDPASPRQESIQKAHPFSSQLTLSLSRIRLDSGDESEEKVCWFNLGSLDDPDQPSTNSDRFIVTRRRGRRKAGNDDDHDEKQLELRDDGTPRGTRTVEPREQHKRATPDIPAPTAQQTSGPSDAFINCPSDNLTVYTEPVTAKRYVVLCGRDYSSDFGAWDIRSLPSPNTNECIARCASDKTGCTAVGWGDYRGNFTCFMKRSIGEPNNAPAWRVAVEDPSQRGTGATPRPELATTAAAQNPGDGGTGLSGDAKAGIGVGVTLGVIMIIAGAVAIWYFEQRRQLRQRAREIEERKLEAASGSTDGGGSSPRVGPPTRGSSYRSDRQQTAAGAAAGMAAIPPNAVGSGSSDAAAGAMNPQAAGSIRSTGSGGAAARGAPGSEGNEGTDATTPPGLAHVSGYLRQQQQFILDSCKQQGGGGGGESSTTSTTPPQKPERAWTGVSDGTPSGHESVVSPWSATGAGPASAAASELPVREGYQGYGPEYEMPSGAEPGGRAPRPHHPGPLWGAEAAEQKFLLSDMAAMKMRVAPDDRTELP
ncbi:hypothetical protein GGTG_07418 [Gaeumannomyces tritici R3-111a-1]|uniref:Apple domain-containing protein n=1 Tax=Gaeumannomyces tritici (strain R3-111a-1) TaxID=644352 RepID=J3P1M0_GAET3|nr:hypothetical protein GGTG_07418 [Gaeumannomyces tritici R3-111a-1]EJT73562.1 hypothetical protein GGTG_07418 [Gaeumannomyces tritici R3-111a-1]